MTQRIFLSFIPQPLAKKLALLFRGPADILLRFFSRLPDDLAKYDYDYSANEYVSIGLVSYTFLGGLVGFLMFTLFFRAAELDIARALVLGALIGFAVVFLFLFLGVSHPRSQALATSADIERYLLYALRDFSLQISSGNTIFQALSNAADADYGSASKELEIVVKEINVGVPMDQVLHKGIERSESEFLQKTYWTILNSLYSGADLRRGIASIISDLDYIQKSRIENYARELSLWSLIYMMAAVAVPTIGMTMMVILSAFAGFGLTQGTFILFVVVLFIMQIGLIVFVGGRRPVVDF